MDRVKVHESPYYGRYNVRFVGVVDAFTQDLTDFSHRESFGSYTVTKVIERTEHCLNPVFLLWVAVHEDNLDYVPQAEYATKIPRLKRGGFSRQYHKLPFGIREKDLNRILAKHGKTLEPLCDIDALTQEEVIAFYRERYKGRYKGRYIEVQHA